MSSLTYEQGQLTWFSNWPSISNFSPGPGPHLGCQMAAPWMYISSPSLKMLPHLVHLAQVGWKWFSPAWSTFPVIYRSQWWHLMPNCFWKNDTFYSKDKTKNNTYLVVLFAVHSAIFVQVLAVKYGTASFTFKAPNVPVLFQGNQCLTLWNFSMTTVAYCRNNQHVFTTLLKLIIDLFTWWHSVSLTVRGRDNWNLNAFRTETLFTGPCYFLSGSERLTVNEWRWRM